MPQSNISANTTFNVSVNSGPASSSPGGADKQIQFNDNGVFGGVPNTFWDGTVLRLGDIDKLSITGGNVGEVLTTDGAGVLSFAPADIAPVVPHGPEFSVQVKDGTDFIGTADLTHTPGNGVTYMSNANVVFAGVSTANIGTLNIGTRANIGGPSKLRITGGTDGQFLQTNGAGTVRWATPDFVPTPASGGDYEIQFALDGEFSSSANLTWDEITNTLIANNVSAGQIYGNGTNITDITGANVSGIVPFANYAYHSSGASTSDTALYADVAGTASFVTESTQSAITKLGTLTELTVRGQTDLGDVANVRITGGATGQVLTTDGDGELTWSDAGAVSRIVAGTGVTISPTNGLGEVTINATGGAAVTAAAVTFAATANITGANVQAAIVEIDNARRAADTGLSGALANTNANVANVASNVVTLTSGLANTNANLANTDANVANLVADLADYVPLAGGTMTGYLTLNADPESDLQAATKQYVDDAVAAAEGIDANAFVHITGNTMTGYLTLNADPESDLQAATKQYVDAAVEGVVIITDAANITFEPTPNVSSTNVQDAISEVDDAWRSGLVLTDADVANLVLDIGNTNANLANTDANVANLVLDIGNTNANVANTDANIANLVLDIGNTNANVANTDANVANLVLDIGNTNANVANTDANVANLVLDIANTNANLANTDANVANLVLDIANTNANLANTDANVANLVLDIGNTNANLANTDANVANLVLDIGNTNANVANTDANVANLVLDIANTNANLANTDANVANLVLDIGNTNANLANTDANVANLVADLADYVPLAGGTMTGILTLSADPEALLDAATKQYVDDSITNATPNLLPYMTKALDNLITANIKTSSSVSPLDSIEMNSRFGSMEGVVGKPVTPQVGTYALGSFDGAGADWQKRDSLTNDTIQGIYINTNTAQIVLEGDGESVVAKTRLNIGNITLLGNDGNPAVPTLGAEVTTKQYVDDAVAGIEHRHYHLPCHVATPWDLATHTGHTVVYDNGAAGVGATLTFTTGTIGAIDGQTVSNGQRVLVAFQTDPVQNGVYVKLSNTVLQRPTTEDQGSDYAGGDVIYVETGNVYAMTLWALLNPAPQIGVDPIVFGVSGASVGSIVASNVGFIATGVITSTDVQNAVVQVHDLAVDKTGSTMTGFLTLSGDPTANLHAATKAYVDTKAANYVLKTGDSMTGALTHTSGMFTSSLDSGGLTHTINFGASNSVGTYNAIGAQLTDATQGNTDLRPGSLLLTNPNGSPVLQTANSEVTTKLYVDNKAANYVPLAGGTMTGALTLNGTPGQGTHAADKNYVDGVAGTKLSRTGGTMTGSLTLAADPTANLQAATKAYVDSRIGAESHYASVAFLADTAINGSTANTAIVFTKVNTLGGGMTYNATTGGFQLTAGRTYRLQAALGGQGGSNYAYYAWKNAANALIGSSSTGGAVGQGTTRSDSPINIAEAIYTPSANEIVFLKTQAGGSGTVTAKPQGVTGFSSAWATITEIQQPVIANPTNSVIAADVAFAPSGNVTATNVQTAIVQVNTQNVSKTGDSMSGPLTIGPIGNLIVTGGSSGQVITTDGAGNLSFATPASSGIKYAREWHVSNQDGNDTTGDGSYNKPYATIAKFLAVIGGGGPSTDQVLYLHGGTYSENVTWPLVNTDILGVNNSGLTYLTGTWNFTGVTGSASVRVQGAVFIGNVTHSGAVGLYFQDVTFGNSTYPNTLTKSSNSYMQLIDCETNGVSAFNITGSGTVLMHGGAQRGITVNNTGATVSVQSSFSCAATTVTAGSFIAVDSWIFSTTAGTPAVTAVASAQTVVALNSCRVYGPTLALERISIPVGVAYTIINSTFDRNNSTLLGTNLGNTGYADSLTTFGNLTVGGVSTLGAVGNVRITGGTSGQVLTSNGAGGLSFTTISTSSISNGTSNVAIAASGGNVTVGVGAVANVATFKTTGANITGTLGVSGITNLASNLNVTGTSNLGAVGNVVITGGSNAQVLTTNGSGVLSWNTPTTPGTTDYAHLTTTSTANISAGSVIPFTVAAGTLTGANNGVVLKAGKTYRLTAACATASGWLQQFSWYTLAGATLGVPSFTESIVSGSTSTNSLQTTASATYTAAVDTTVIVKMASDGSVTNNPLNPTISWAYVEEIGSSSLTGNINIGGGAASTSTTTGAVVVNGGIGISGNAYIGTNLNVAGTSNLGPVSNVVITGGTTGQVLTTNGSGVLSWGGAQPGIIEYVAVSRLGTEQTGVTSGTDLILNTRDAFSGSVGTNYNTTTGVFTLSVGNTYELLGMPSFNAFSDNTVGYIEYQWCHAGNNAPITSAGAQAGIAQPNNNNTNESNSDLAYCIYTAAAGANTVKLRVTATNASGAGSATLRNAYTKATVKQLGTNSLASNVSLGGGAASTSTTTGGVVVSGGLGVSGNAYIGANLNVAGTSNLGAVGNVTITGGTTAQVLTTNGSGVLSWSTPSGATVATYSSVHLTSNQTIAAPGTPTNIIFQNASGTIPYNAATGVWTLSAGVTYQLTVGATVADPGMYMAYKWVDAVTGTFLSGAEGWSTSPQSPASDLQAGPVTIIYTPSANQTVSVRQLNGQYGIWSAFQTWAAIVQVAGSTLAGNVTIGGGAASTSTTTGGVVVSGGLGVSGDVFAGNLARKKTQIVATGVDVTLDNIRIRMPATGRAELQISTVTGTAAFSGSLSGIDANTPYGFAVSVTATTTPAYMTASGTANFSQAGDEMVYTILNAASNLMYRISAIPDGAGNYGITIEALI
jgi:hypothetical protein